MSMPHDDEIEAFGDFSTGVFAVIGGIAIGISFIQGITAGGTGQIG